MGVKSYRDKYSNGVITFGKGLKISLLITLIRQPHVWAPHGNIPIRRSATSSCKKWSELKIAEMKSDGASEAAIAEWKQESAQMVELYKNFFFRFAFTVIIEIFPVGVIISLISAALLRKKEFLPATEPAITQ